MDKNRFLQIMEKGLSGIPREEKKDILFDYSEHFDMGKADGKTEDEISKALGNPSALAKKYRAEYYVGTAEREQTAGSLFRAVLATLGLGVFNLLFVLGPFIGLLAFLFAMFALSFAVAASGIAIFMSVTHLPIPWGMVNIPAFFYDNTAASIFFSVGLAALGSLMLIVSGYITMWVFKIALGYLKININIIARR